MRVSSSCLTAAESTPRALATRATCRDAFAGEMCGSSPDADAVTASDGIVPFATPPAIRLSARGPMSESASFLSVGPLFVAADAAASKPFGWHV